MSEEPTISIEIFYERTTQPAQYQSAKAGIRLQVAYPGSLSPEQIISDAQEMFKHAKSEVLGQLALSSTYSDETNRIMEAFPDSVVVSASRKPSGPLATAQARVAAIKAVPNEPEPEPEYDDFDSSEDYEDPGYEEEEPPPPPPKRQRATMAPVKGASSRTRGGSDAAVKADPWGDLMANPGNWWDNRQNKRNVKGPDFAHKTIKDGAYSLGLWLSRAPSDFENPFGD